MIQPLARESEGTYIVVRIEFSYSDGFLISIDQLAEGVAFLPMRSDFVLGGETCFTVVTRSKLVNGDVTYSEAAHQGFESFTEWVV